MPIIYLFFKKNDSVKTNYTLTVLILIFFLINRIYAYIPNENHGDIEYKLFRISFLPWFYMFLIGVFFQKNFTLFYKLLAGKFVLTFLTYCIVIYIAHSYKLSFNNNINPVVFIFLTATAFSFAYSFVGLSKKLLKGNDISYGAYIYHMPVVNFMLYSGFYGMFSNAVYALLITILLATASWLLIEKRSLRFKKHPLNPLNNLTKK